MDKDDKMLLATYVSLGAVIGGVVLAIALASLVPIEVNAILLILFFLYLVWLGNHASGASTQAQKWFRQVQERRFYRSRMSTVIQKRIETVMRDLQTLTSGEGSIEKVAEKFFERPNTPAYPTTNHPLLADALPDLSQVRDLLMENKDLLGLSFRRLDEMGSDLMREVRISICSLDRFVNCYIAWIVRVIDVLAKHKGTCPAVSYANSSHQYSILQRSFLQLVADLDSLSAAFNNAASTDPSVCSELSLTISKRVLDPFP